MTLLSILIDVLIFLLASIPLYFAIKLLGSKSSFLTVVLVNFLTGIIFAFLRGRFLFGTLIAFILFIWIYHEVFRLKWYKAVLAWILQWVFIIVFYVVLFFLLILLGLRPFTEIIPFVFRV